MFRNSSGLKFNAPPFHIIQRFPDLNDRQYLWHPIRQRMLCPRPWRDWVEEPGSLTTRLMALAEGNLNVEVLEETWVACDPKLKVFLEMNKPQPMWSRMVVLKGKGQPWVVAHSLIPQTSLRSKLQNIRHLNTKPLGALLFNTPGCVRAKMQFTKSDTGWGRRSLFSLYKKPLLVAEYFLPELIEYADKSHS